MRGADNQSRHLEVMLSRKFNMERVPGVISDVHGPLRPVATHITLSR